MHRKWIIGALVMTAVLTLAGCKTDRSHTASTEKLECLKCHRQPNTNTNEGVVAANEFCMNCHARGMEGNQNIAKKTSISLSDFNDQPHKYVACIHCHRDVARSPHRSVRGAECLSCHNIHGDKEAGDPHLRVACQACHFRHENMTLDTVTNRVVLSKNPKDSTGLIDHRLDDPEDPAVCARCHVKGNSVGAPAKVLPPKNILCIVCHPAPASFGNIFFSLFSVVFFIGIILMVSFWFKGSVSGEERSLHKKIALASENIWQVIFSRKIMTIARLFIVDVFLQRRLLKESVLRWSIHTLIFWAILFRLIMSLFTGLLSEVAPSGSLFATLVDKNSLFCAFFYDLTGMLLLIGVVWAAVQRMALKPAHVSTEFQDNFTVGLLACLVLLGFLTTATRLAMTQVPQQIAIYSFAAYPLSRLLATLPVSLSRIYPYLWYAHAILAALFVACVPFGKLKHMLNVPLTYVVEEIGGIKKDKRV